MNDAELLRAQRQLRGSLFEGSSAIRWRPARELAAQLLLYLDDRDACWRLTTAWLRETLGADRVDGGFGGYVARDGGCRAYTALAEAHRGSICLPSLTGVSMDLTAADLHLVWNDARGVAAFPDLMQERGLTGDLRAALVAQGTSAELVLPLSDGGRPIGLVCADWQGRAPRWNAEACNHLGELARGVLGPVLAAAARVGGSDLEPVPTASDALAPLTPAELKVARLVATGLSYKEVARQLNRSFSTVDHQLRSIREKTGAGSMARLVRLLNQRLDHLAA